MEGESHALTMQQLVAKLHEVDSRVDSEASLASQGFGGCKHGPWMPYPKALAHVT